MASAATQVNQNTSHRPTASAWLIVLNVLLVVATLVVYAPVRHYPFINYDDPWYVAHNPYIKDGLTPAMFRWAFMERGYCHNWHPVTWISHALDIQLFGLDPGAHHDVNVLLHALGAVLLFWMLRQATGYTGRSFMVAGLFSLHPINVESVAWISERKTLLSMIFFVLVFAAYRWYARKPDDTRYSLVAGLYILGLMAKPQVIPLPVLLLLWDFWPLQRLAGKEQAWEVPIEVFPQRTLRQLIVEKIPLLVIGIGSAAITMLAQEVGPPQHWPYTVSVRVENAIVSYARYLGKAVWPVRLAPFYPHPGSSLTAWQVGSSLALLLLITGLVAVGRRHRYLVVGWLWFLIAMRPMIGIIQVWEQGMADRYGYQSFIGLFIIACWGCAEVASRLHVPKPVLAAVSVVVLLSLGMAAHNQTRYWSDSVAVWTRSLEITPQNNYVGEQSLGYVLTISGRQAEAMPHLLHALQLRPDDPLSNLEVARYDESTGKTRDAIEYFKRALAAPDSVPGQKHLALTSMAHDYEALGDADLARQCWEQASKLPPDDPQP